MLCSRLYCQLWQYDGLYFSLLLSVQWSTSTAMDTTNSTCRFQHNEEHCNLPAAFWETFCHYWGHGHHGWQIDYHRDRPKLTDDAYRRTVFVNIPSYLSTYVEPKRKTSANQQQEIAHRHEASFCAWLAADKEVKSFSDVEDNLAAKLSEYEDTWCYKVMDDSIWLYLLSLTASLWRPFAFSYVVTCRFMFLLMAVVFRTAGLHGFWGGL